MLLYVQCFLNQVYLSVSRISETGSEELFKSEDCKPSIYLVADHENCVG